MQPREYGVSMLCIGLLLVAMQTTSQASPGVVRDEAVLKRLVSDTTWEIQVRKSPTVDRSPMYWGWTADGKFCARNQGMLRTDRCMDEGTWRIENGALCWKLSWWGKAPGHYFNAACADIQDLGEGRYRFKTNPNASGLVFRVLTK